MNNEKKKNINISSIIVSVFFIAAVISVTVLSFIIKDSDFSENENRNLNLMPELNGSAVFNGSFTKDFEKYVQDQFPGRDRFMSVKTRAELAVGKKDNGLVYFGEDGYLFSVDSIDTGQLQENIDSINSFAENCKAEVMLMAVPAAADILNDKLPTQIPFQEEEEAFECLEKNSEVEMLDLREMFREKSDEYIYYRTDHHWTSLGAFYAYQLFSDTDAEPDDYEITEISDEFYGTNYSKALLSSIEPDSMYRYDFKDDKNSYSVEIYDSTGKQIKKMNSFYDDDYLEMKDKYSYYLSGNNPVTFIKRQGKEDDTGKSILIVKDSFAHCFIPFIAPDYDTVVAIDMRYYRSSPEDIMEKYGTDQVLFLYNIVNLSNDTNLVFINR